jgi:hypothetical protein
MARIFTSGFEFLPIAGTTADGWVLTGSSATPATGTVRSGTYALHCNPPLGTQGNLTKTIVPGTAPIYVRFWFYCNAWPPSLRTICVLGGQTNGLYLKLNTTGTIVLAGGSSGGTIYCQTAGTFSPNTWTSVMIKASIATSSAVHELKTLGQTITNSTADPANVSITTMQIGLLVNSTSPQSDIWFDDIAINNSI